MNIFINIYNICMWDFSFRHNVFGFFINEKKKKKNENNYISEKNKKKINLNVCRLCNRDEIKRTRNAAV